MNLKQLSKSDRMRRFLLIIVVLFAVLAVFLLTFGLLFGFHPRSTPVLYTIADGLIGLDSYGYRSYEFTVFSNVASQRIEGSFAVMGEGEEIAVYILGEEEFSNWLNGPAFTQLYNSGEVTEGKINVSNPPGGKYHLVFDNTFSATPKNVTANIATIVSTD